MAADEERYALQYSTCEQLSGDEAANKYNTHMNTNSQTTHRTNVADEYVPWRFGHQRLKRLLENAACEPRVIREAIQMALASMSNGDPDEQLNAQVTTANLTPADVEHVLECAIRGAEMVIYQARQNPRVTTLQESRALNLIRNALWLPLPKDTKASEPKSSTKQAIRIAELVEGDWITNAWHEAGHVIVLLHYGYHAKARIWGGSRRRMDTTAIKGRTRWHNSPELSRFGLSVFGWAGTIAEKFVDEAEADAKDSWDACGSGDTSDLSATDQGHIYSHHQTWRTFKTAAGILITNYEQLKTIADELRRTHVWDSRRSKSKTLVASICG